MREVMPMNGPNEDLRDLVTAIRSLRGQVEDFKIVLRSDTERQMSTLNDLLRWCDFLLYRSSELYRKGEQEIDAPEGSDPGPF